MLQIPSAQHASACENHGNQCKFSNHSKEIKTFLKKKNRDYAKKKYKN